MKILTFDPGKKTGYSVWKTTPNGPEVIEAGVVLNYQQLIKVMENHCMADFCVYEGFARANASTGDQLQAIAMTGAIYCMAEYHSMKVRKQYPAQRKGYIPFAKQTPLPTTVKSEDRPHVIDAVAHGLRFFDKEGFPCPQLQSLTS